MSRESSSSPWFIPIGILGYSLWRYLFPTIETVYDFAGTAAIWIVMLAILATIRRLERGGNR